MMITILKMFMIVWQNGTNVKTIKQGGLWRNGKRGKDDLIRVQQALDMAKGRRFPRDTLFYFHEDIS